MQRTKKNQTPRDFASNHPEILKCLFENGIQFQNDNGEFLDDEFPTLLHYAADKGYFEIVKILLENGVEKESKNKYGFTPLHFAVQGARQF